MLCSVCKTKQATVHLTQIVNDQVQKVDMCEACYSKKGLDDPSNYMMADQALGLVEKAVEALPSPTEVGPACPQCGFTQADFKKTGRFGCANCYRVFSEGLEELLKSMHKGIRHTGKVPGTVRPSASLESEDLLKQTQKRMEQAIAQEDYEQAALLRDEIKSLKAKAAKEKA